jgi:hypothetical protein
MTTTKYAIKYNNSDSYLDQYDCETSDINKAILFDTYTEAIECRKEIDVAYLYEIVRVTINYKIEVISHF